jgi:hypothetical protein
MEQLVAIVLVIGLVSVAGFGLEHGGPVARIIGHVLLVAGGFATGSMVSLLLGLMLWPGAWGALFGAYSPPTPEQDRWAGIMFAVIVGGAGAIIPDLAFRLGYAVGVVVVIQESTDYWASHGGGALLLLGLGCWTVVAAAVWAIRWWLRPDPDTDGGSVAPDPWAHPPPTAR